MYAAGFLECYLTRERVFQMYENMYQAFFAKKVPSPKLLTFFDQQDKWTRDNIRSQNNDHWKQVVSIEKQRAVHVFSLFNFGKMKGLYHQPV